MRSRERLAETLRSINVPVFAGQCLASPLYADIGWQEYFEDLALLLLREGRDNLVEAELYLIKTTSPHYEELIREAREYLGMPF